MVGRAATIPFGVLGLVLTLAASVRAAPVHVHYTASRGCPTEAEFASEVATRVPADAQNRDDFAVQIERDGAEFTGTLTVTRANRPHTRTVRGAECSSVARSLAVFVALALSEEPEPTPPTRVAPASVAPTPAAPAAAAPRARVPRAHIARATLQPAWSVHSGMSGHYTYAGASWWGARTHVELARHFARSSWIPALRMSWGFGDFTPLVDAGKLRFRLRSARAEACLGVAWKSTHEALCAAFDLGQLDASSSGLARNRDASLVWSAPGGIARARLAVLGPFEVELALGASAPLQRAQFTLIDPLRRVYRVPPLTFEAQLGLAISAVWP